jgi:hypothetical protein
MAKCANCSYDAVYVYTVTDTFAIKYCQYHLPRSIARVGTGISRIPVEVAPIEVIVDEKKKTSKKVEPVVEEPVVEEPAVEETPAGE